MWKLNLWTFEKLSDLSSQVMRNTVAQLWSEALNHSESCWIFLCQHRHVTLSKCSGVWDIWGTDLNISHSRCKWIGPFGLRSCQQLTFYESFIHQHIFFPVSSNFWKKAENKCGKLFLFFFKSFFLACWIFEGNWTFVELNHEVVPLMWLIIPNVLTS